MAFKVHPDLPDDLDDYATLWRYVDPYRYLDMLQSRELHLARADSMDDRWEGSFSAVNIRMRPEVYGDDWDVMSSQMEMIYRHGRRNTYLNCWYIGSHESYAMWKLYDVTGKGVAIKTSAGRLKRSLVGGGRVHGAQIQYVDYSQNYIPEGNLFFPYIHKRLSFRHESEYRLLALPTPEEHQQIAAGVQQMVSPPAFLRESIDLTCLVEAIYVSPDAPGWVADVVSRVTVQYLPQSEDLQSDLAADPVY